MLRIDKRPFIKIEGLFFMKKIVNYYSVECDLT